jgi:hypothetical protein
LRHIQTLSQVLRERRSAWEAEAKAAVTSVVDQHYARAAGKPRGEAFEGDLRAAVAEAAVTHLLIPAMGLVGDVKGLGALAAPSAALAAPSADALLTECDEVRKEWVAMELLCACVPLVLRGLVV